MPFTFLLIDHEQIEVTKKRITISHSDVNRTVSHTIIYRNTTNPEIWT